MGQIKADTGLIGVAGAGRQQDACGPHRDGFGNGELIVPVDLNLCAQHPEIMHQVVGKAVVVIN